MTLVCSEGTAWLAAMPNGIRKDAGNRKKNATSTVEVEGVQLEGEGRMARLMAATMALLQRYTGDAEHIDVLALDLDTDSRRTAAAWVEHQCLADSTLKEAVCKARGSLRKARWDTWEGVADNMERKHGEENAVFPELVLAIVRESQGGLVKALETAKKTLPSGRYTWCVTLTVPDLPESKGQKCFLSYDAGECFLEADPKTTANHLGNLLEMLERQPHSKANDVCFLGTQEKEALLHGVNNTSQPFPKGKCIHELFSLVAQTSPYHPALVCTGRKPISYGELDRFSNQIARKLRQEGARRGEFVAIYLDRSPDLVAGLLGIMKSGAAYVPLDPVYPHDRIRMMLEDSKCKLVLTNAALSKYLREWRIDAKAIALDDPETSVHSMDGGRVDLHACSPEDPVYVIFTSGSTGRPKGVIVKHLSLVNTIHSFKKTTQINVRDKFLALTTICFDIAGLELYMPLVSGATVALAFKEEAADASLLQKVMEDAKITMMQATPVTYKMLFAAGWAGSSQLTCLCGGEALPADLASALKPVVKRLLNVYGPTETTIWSTYAEIEDDGIVHIGRPIDNTTVYILNSQGQLQPVGVQGELFIGGVGVSEGYLGRPDLTEERFIPSPFNSQETLYATGDYARWNWMGYLECLGRIDHQVKVHGFRIELGEIESVLVKHPLVHHAVVDARPLIESGDEQLVAYVVPSVGSEDASEDDSTSKSPPGEAEEDKQDHAKSSETDLSTVGMWASIYDEAYASQNALTDDPTLNFSGYDNSYTPRVPHKTAVVREWVETTCDRIAALKPVRVLEQGCGNGMIFFRCAKSCERYIGADLSEQAVRYVETVMKQPKFTMPWASVTLAGAHESLQFADEKLDTIVCNGVSMYFPSAGYLLDVIRNSVSAIVPGGKFFLGDVRNNQLLRHFHASVETFKASGDTSISELQLTIKKGIKFEKELLVDPLFFLALPQSGLVPGLAHVKLEMKRGIHHSEFSMFRYDVTFYKEGDDGYKMANSDVPVVDMKDDPSPEETLTRHLEERKEAFAVTGLLDARLADEMALMKILFGQSTSPMPNKVEELRDQVQRESAALTKIEPETVYQKAEELGYVAELFWQSTPGSLFFDALFVPRDSGEFYPSVVELTLNDDVADNAQLLDPIDRYTNKWSEETDGLTPQDIGSIRASLRDCLPEYMVPPVFISLEQMPLTNNGKVDRKALPAPSLEDMHTNSSRTEFVQPGGDVEVALAKIWSALLRDPEISALDDFFNLGGHSLMAIQLVGEIRKEWGVEVSVAELHENSVLRSLADLLSQKCAGANAAKNELPESLALPDSVNPQLRAVLPNELKYQVQEIPHCWVPLSDGTRLSVKLWLPSVPEGPGVPAIIDIIPYLKDHGTLEIDSMTYPYLAGNGYACMRVDVRGCGDSEGVLDDEYTERQQKDAEECIAWAASQTWCTGQVVLMGCSWGGFTSLQLAARKAPNLVAAIAVCSTDDRQQDDMHFMNGALLTDNLSWGAWMLHTASQPPDPKFVGEDSWLQKWKDRLEKLQPPFTKWMEHGGAKDPYWEMGSIRNKLHKIDIPMLVVGGTAAGNYHNAVSRIVSKVATAKGIIGPWSHNFPHTSPLGPQGPFLQQVLSWLDAHLLGTKSDNLPKMSVYAQRPSGQEPSKQPSNLPGTWIASKLEGPLLDCTSDLTVHLAPKSALQTLPSPKEKVAIPGSCITCAKEIAGGKLSQPPGLQGGACVSFGNGPDSATNQVGDDALSALFDMQEFQEDMIIVGCPKVSLYIDCEASPGVGRGNVCVRLEAVSPSKAISQRLTYGVASLKQAKETQQGYLHVELDLNFTAFVIPKGWQLRLAITRDYWPIAWPSSSPSVASVFTGVSTLQVAAAPARSPGVGQAVQRAQAQQLPEALISAGRKVSTVRGGKQSRDVDHCSSTRKLTVTRTDDNGSRKFEDINLVLDSSKVEKFSVGSVEDPSRHGFSHDISWRTAVERDAWKTESQLQCRMSEVNGVIRVMTKLRSLSGKEVVFEKEWEEEVVRTW